MEVTHFSLRQRLTVEFRYTHDEVATLLGMSRVHVTNLLSLLNLDARIQHWMKQGYLSVGHGKSLVGQALDPVKVSLNKNEAGYFRIHFHDREHMQTIL